MSRAASSLSSSTSDLPTGMPRALKNVYAIAPPMSSRSTLREQILDDLDLVRDLRAAQDRDERPLRRFERVAEVAQLLLHQQSGGRLPARDA